MARKENPLHDHPRSRISEETREAKKGDRRTMDKEIQDGRDKIEFKGEYESIGIEKRKDDQKIDPEDREEMSRANEAYRKGGKKGPTPTFKDVPKDEDRKRDTDEDGYEIWMKRPKREIPTS
jgi:hypothetical protein